MNIVTINAGSSSIKFKIYKKQNHKKATLYLHGQIRAINSKQPCLSIESKGTTINETLNLGADVYTDAVKYLVRHCKFRQFSIDAVINRVVHGGDDYCEITLLHDKTLASLSRFNELAPLHQPYNLLIAKFFMQNFPQAKHYACFDTAFHQTMPLINRIYAIPWQYTLSGVKRYGFHGLSYQYLSECLRDTVENNLAKGRWIMAHLGSGSSVCAVRGYKSVSTTMGFSVAEGLPMATRCGELDPQIPIYLVDKFKLSEVELNHLLYYQSGILGISDQLSSDMQTLLKSKDDKARLAVEFYCLQVACYISKLVATLGGIEGIIFTGGIGENSAVIRFNVLQRLGFLGIEISKRANNANKLKIHKKNARVKVLVIAANEELAMINQLVKRYSGL